MSLLKRSRYFYAAIGLLLVAASSRLARAGEIYDFYDGVRGLGMGNAVVATVDDETAIYLNPAALGRVRNYFINIADPQVDVGQDTPTMVNTGYLDSINPQYTLNDANKYPNKHLHQREQLSPSLVMTNFGIGVLDSYQTDAYLDSATNTYHYHYWNDQAITAAFNLSMFSGILKLGANIRGVDRTESNRTDIPVNSTGLTATSMINGSTLFSEGFGIASDAGLLLTLPVATLPTIGVVWRDIGDTRYDINHGSQYSTTYRPLSTPDTIDAGASISPILGNGVRMVLTAQLSDVTQNMEPTYIYQSPNIMRRVHAGVEFNFGDTLFVRGGINQGYWTAGLEMDIANSQLQLASYGEEIGDVPLIGSGQTYTPVQDRRYVFEYAFRY